LNDLKVEIVSTPRASPNHTTMKDVTLVAGLKHWRGDNRGRLVYEFFAKIDTYEKVSNWADDEKALIGKAILQGIALQFVQGKEFLANDACPYEVLRDHLIERFNEKMPAHYDYTKLQDAKQEKM